MNEITKKQHCVLIRGGIELWIDAEKVETLVSVMQTQKLIQIDGEIVNTFEIIGVYSPERMEEFKRHKQGQWKCKMNTWHDKSEKCGCRKIKRNRRASAKSTFFKQKRKIVVRKLKWRDANGRKKSKF